MQLSCVIITLQIFWAKPGNPREGGRVERSNEWGGRSREGEARAKPGNQLVCNTSQCELRSLLLNSGMLNVVRIVTYYTLPPLESPDSFWIAMAFSR